MELKYIYAQSSSMLPSIEIQKTTVYFRRNFVEEVRTDNSGNTYTIWVFEEAMMPVEEFNAYASKLVSINAVKAIDDSENIKDLKVGQENGDNNQLIIMEAIADLYDAIASMM